MPETCPLQGGTNYWRAESEAQNGIPAVCRTQCEPRWDYVIDNDNILDVDEITDMCDDDSLCSHSIEVDDMSLQKREGQKRIVGLLNVCEVTRVELFSEQFVFNCPNDQA